MPPRDDPFLSSRGFPRASGTPRPASTTTARVRFPGFRVFAPVRLPGPEGPVAIGRALPVTVAGTAAASTAFPKPRALSGTLGAQRPDRQSALYKKRRRHAKARSCEEFETRFGHTSSADREGLWKKASVTPRLRVQIFLRLDSDTPRASIGSSSLFCALQQAAKFIFQDAFPAVFLSHGGAKTPASARRSARAAEAVPVFSHLWGFSGFGISTGQVQEGTRSLFLLRLRRQFSPPSPERHQRPHCLDDAERPGALQEAID